MMNFPELPWSSTRHKPAVTRAQLDGGAQLPVTYTSLGDPSQGGRGGERETLRLSAMVWEI